MDTLTTPQVEAAPAGRGSHPVRAAARSRPARMIGALAALALAGAGGWYAWQTWGGAASASAPPLTATVVRGTLEDTVTATGTLQPRDYVDVGTQVSGQVKKLYVDIGSVVKSGELLAELDSTVYTSKVEGDRAQLRTLQAQLADRQGQLALAEQQLQRQQNMMLENATTKEALQTAEAALRSARAQIDVYKAQIDQMSSTLRGDEANLGYTKIYAPMSGTVVSQSAKQGQTLNANQQAPVLLRIADLSTMTVQSQVSEADISALQVGMSVYFTTLGSQDKRWYSTLRQVNPTPETVNNVVLYNALFDVANPDRALMTQMTAQIFFVVTEARDAVLVPVAALQRAGGNAAGRQRQGKGAAQDGAAVDGKAAAPESKRGSAEKGAGKGGAKGAGKEGAASADPRARFANRSAMVQVVKPDGSIEAREVRVGVMSRVTAQILSGLEPGEQVVIGQRSPDAAKAKSNAKSNAQPKMTPRI